MSGQVELAEEYCWIDLAPSALDQAMEEVISGFFGGNFDVHANLKWEGSPEISKDYETVEAWQQDISDDVHSIWLWLRSKNGREVNFSGSPQHERLRIQVTVPEQDTQDAKDLLTSIQTILGLTRLEKEDRRYLKKDRLGLRRTYRSPKPSDLKQLIALLKTYIDSNDRVSTDFTLVLSSGDEVRNEDIEAWFEKLQERWDDITKIVCWLDLPNHKINFYHDFDRAKVVVDVEAETEQQVAQVMTAIERSYSLSKDQVLLPSQNLVGLSFKYVLSEKIDKPWFKRSVEILRSWTDVNIYFTGEFQITSMPHTRFEQNSIEGWSTDVIRRWDDIVKSRFYSSGQMKRVDMECDHRRDLVDITINARTQEEIQEFKERLEDELNLTLVEDPVYSLRSTGRFEIVSWRNTNFAEAVEQSISQFFEKTPVVVEATVFEGTDTLEVTTFKDKQSYLERLRESTPFTETHFVVEGSERTALGIHVIEDLGWLELRSTLEPQEFPMLAKVFKRNLGIRPPKKTSKDSGKSEKTKIDTWVKFLPIVTLILGFVLSPTFWGAIFPEHELRITVPPPGDSQEPVIISSTEALPVEWVLETEHWFKESINRDSLARVRVLENGIYEVQTLQNCYPGVPLKLEPGTYDVIVYSMISEAEDRVTIMIPSD